MLEKGVSIVSMASREISTAISLKILFDTVTQIPDTESAAIESDFAVVNSLDGISEQTVH